MNVGVENGVRKDISTNGKGTIQMMLVFFESLLTRVRYFIGNWIPGFPKENHMDFLITIKICI